MASSRYNATLLELSARYRIPLLSVCLLASLFAVASFDCFSMAPAAALVLSMVACAIWWNRSQHSTYGWLVILLLFWAPHGSALNPVLLPFNYRALWDLNTLWAVSVNVLFVRRLFDLPNRKSEWLFFIPPLVISLITIAAPRSIDMVSMLQGVRVNSLLYAFYVIFLLARAGLMDNRGTPFILLFEGVIVAIGIFGALIFSQLISSSLISTRLGLTIFLIAPALMMVCRTMLAKHALDRSADKLQTKATDGEQEFQRPDEALSIKRESLLISEERDRVMRELHDGISGDIVSIIALAEGTDPDLDQIARHARHALTDMRLIVFSLENYGGDLSLALGAWRERMESQVRAASIRLKWNVSDIPVLDWLNPAHVLDILRILQEAVANAVQHSGAATIEVDCHIVAEHIRITVVDNGHGCQSIERMNGKGLVNMRTRANRLGAALEIQSTSEGTSVVLLLSLADAGRAIPPEAAQQA
jgi:signal transduction histidine kinase